MDKTTVAATMFSKTRKKEALMTRIGNLTLGLVALLGVLSFSQVAEAQSAYSLVQNAGTSLTKRRVLNCTGGITCADNAGALKTTISMGGSGAMALSSGNLSWTGASGATLSFISTGPSSAMTLTAGAASTWSTSSGALTIDSAAALNLGNTTATSMVMGSSAMQAMTFSAQAATARAGERHASTRFIIRNSSVAVPDCSGGALNLTVTQFLDAGVATCGTAQTITFPTWQGASGIVQNLPGAPAVGDVVEFLVSASAASALTVAAGTGGTLGGSATVPANTDKLYRCRLTSVTASSETATCY